METHKAFEQKQIRHESIDGEQFSSMQTFVLNDPKTTAKMTSIKTTKSAVMLG